MKKFLVGLVLVAIAAFLSIYVGCIKCFYEPLVYLATCIRDGSGEWTEISIAMLKVTFGFLLSLAGALVFLVCGKTLIDDR